MRRALLSHLACPACRGALSLAEREASDQAIQEGTLRCEGCASRYPVRQGVPRFPIAEQEAVRAVMLRTQAAYNFTWRHFGRAEVEQRWEKDSSHYLKLIPSHLLAGPGRIGLDAGCGAGADLLRVSAGGADVIGVDLSEGVDVAARLTRRLPNAHVVQADLHRLPFRERTFDFIYSFGVLHHLPDPSQTLCDLARLLKPGGALITYLYEDFSARSGMERMLLGIVAAIRRVTCRLPARLLHLLCWLGVPAVWLCCSVPARLLRPLLPQVAARVPFRHTLRWPVLVSDLFDRFAPPLEWRFNPAQISRLYAQAGLGGVELVRYRGWVAWGMAGGGPR